MNSFHNTTQEQGEILVSSETKARTQDEKIYKFFQVAPPHKFTPEEVWKTVFDAHTPLTSVRRAMSNLSKINKLWKTREQTTGMYNKTINYWKIAEMPI